MTSSHHGSYIQGYTRATMAATDDVEHAGGGQTPHSASVRMAVFSATAGSWNRCESWMCYATVNTFPSLVHTARHAMEAVRSRSRCVTPQGAKPPKVLSVTVAKS